MLTGMGTINRHAVRALRNARNWTLRDLAELSNVDIGTLSKIENGLRTNPSQVTIQKLADTFSVLPSAITNICSLCEGRMAS